MVMMVMVVVVMGESCSGSGTVLQSVMQCVCAELKCAVAVKQQKQRMTRASERASNQRTHTERALCHARVKTPPKKSVLVGTDHSRSPGRGDGGGAAVAAAKEQALKLSG